MSKTYLQVVNDVLRRLREDQVTATTDSDYAEMVGQLVSDAYKEVQDQHLWESLKHTINISIEAGRTEYTLSMLIGEGGDVPNDERACRHDSELLWDELGNSCPQVWLFDDGSDTTGISPMYVPPERLASLYNDDTSQTGNDVMYFSVYPRAFTDQDDPDLILEVYPTPTTSRIMRMRFWTAADELDPDGTDDSKRIRIPDRPVYLLALFHALNERGEEIGEPGNVAESRYVDALAFAMEKDINMAQRSGRYDWRRG